MKEANEPEETWWEIAGDFCVGTRFNRRRHTCFAQNSSYSEV